MLPWGLNTIQRKTGAGPGAGKTCCILRATPVKNIFVGNLDFNTSEEDVRQLFAATVGWTE